MKKMNLEELSNIEGGAWWRDALDFTAGVCAGTAAVRGIAALASVAVPGSQVLWGSIAIGCLAVGAAAGAT